MRRGSCKAFSAFDVPYLAVLHLLFLFHRPYVVHAERKHVVVAYGIHYRISVQAVAKHIFRGLVDASAGRHVFSEDGRAGEAEQVVFLEPLGDEPVHVAELRAVAFVENHHHLFLVELALRVPLDVGSKLLDGGDDNLALRMADLPLQFFGGRVAVGRPLLEAVILFHGLVVEVFTVYHEKHLVDVGEFRGKLRGLERSERFARPRGVPHVSSGITCAIQPGVVRHLDAVQQAFGSRYLVRAHGHEDFLFGQHAKAGQHVEQRVAAEKCGRKVLQVA